MHRRFEKPEEWTKNFDNPERDKWQLPAQVIEALAIQPSHKVADIGAGTGYFTMRLAKVAAKVFAADIEKDMVEFLNKRAAPEGLSNVTAVQAPADSANLPEKVDLIIIVDTYHHIGHRVAYFKRLAKSLKPGTGRLAIIDWKPEDPMGPPKEFRFPAAQIAEELHKAGYKQTAQHAFLPNQSFTIYQPAHR